MEVKFISADELYAKYCLKQEKKMKQPKCPKCHESLMIDDTTDTKLCLNGDCDFFDIQTDIKELEEISDEYY